MNISYNAAITIICAALGWPIEKARHVMMTDMKIHEPQDRDATGLVPASRLGEFIRLNYCDRLNHEY